MNTYLSRTRRLVGRPLRVLAAVALALAFLPGGSALADTDAGNLPAGTSISVAINTPPIGAVLPPGSVAVTGVAQVGQGVTLPNTSLIYVEDVSGSTIIAASSGPGCGGDPNGDGLSNSVLDCEIAASKQLNAQSVALGTVGEAGMILFAEGAVRADMQGGAGDQPFTTPGTNVDTVLNSLFSSSSGGNAGANQFSPKTTNAGGTNFAAAITQAVSLVGIATKPSKMVVFLSDGEATGGGSIVGPLGTVPPGVKFFTFAVGSASTCGGNPFGLGSLQDIANATGGTCTQVTNAAALPNILPGVIASQLTSLQISVDGGAFAPLAATPVLPQSGPTSATFSTSVSLTTAGSHTICVRANGSDAGGTGSVQDCHTITINAAPVVNAGGPYTGNEGAAINIAGSVVDADGPSLTSAWTYAPAAGVDPGASCTFASAGSPSTTVTCTDDGTYTLTLTANDSVNPPVVRTAQLSVANVAPVLTIAAPAAGSLYAVGTPVNLTSTFTDAGANDTHTCAISWDDGTSGPGLVNQLADTCTASHTFAGAGVYTISVTLTDDDGASDVETVMVVVYDPSAGFVTGGGWINSPSGAYTADPTLTGRATFGFVSKYRRGAAAGSSAEGQTEFQLQAGSFNFHSDDYQWLVVAGARAQYKGTGTVNGVGGYGFLLTATDGQIAGGGGVDKFRIKIWNTSTSAVVYDNVLGGSEDIDAANPQVIGGGSIVIHSN